MSGSITSTPRPTSSTCTSASCVRRSTPGSTGASCTRSAESATASPPMTRGWGEGGTREALPETPPHPAPPPPFRARGCFFSTPRPPAPPFARLLRSASVRFALSYALVFIVSPLLLVGYLWWRTTSYLEQEPDAVIVADTRAMGDRL